MKIVSVVGARPNFVKIAPLIREMRRHDGIESILVHTGQHYDDSLAGQFFRELELPPADVLLNVGSGSHAYQTAEVMKRLEPVLTETRPDVLLVVGDVNSTVAGALTGAKLGIPVAHVEAGLRSFDGTMPEEINRRVADVLSDYLFVTEESGRRNLLREGIHPGKIHLVGNVMIDSLEQSRPAWERSLIHARLGVKHQRYGVVTLHRPSNVDADEALESLVGALGEVSRQIPLIFPVHPRTKRRMAGLEGLLAGAGPGDSLEKGILCVEPLGYMDFMALVAKARIVLTDSGGLQEEATALGVQCLTLREQTERPVTVTHGTNQVVGTSPSRIVAAADRVLNGPPSAWSRPYLWDGRTSERIVGILREQLAC